jgi:hypothetical protein
MADDVEEPEYPRRYVQGAGGRQLLAKARECARAIDGEAAFAEVLHRLGYWEGMPQFENGMAMFQELRQELRLRERR